MAGELKRLAELIRPGETVYHCVSRLNATGPRVCQFMDIRTSRDYRPATPRRVLAALKRCASTGYQGRCLWDYVFGTQTAPASDLAAINSVARLIQFQR